MIGKKFGRLTVLEELPERKHGSRVYRCKCDCGNIKDVRSDTLRNGSIKSCGCLSRKVNGLSKDPIYNIYRSMKDRCHYKNRENYDWAINNGYKKGLTIDRIDNSGNYDPDNCQWATPKQQANNRRSNVHLTYDNETHTMMEWSHILHIPYITIRMRHQKGWTDKECLFGKEK